VVAIHRRLIESIVILHVAAVRGVLHRISRHVLLKACRSAHLITIGCVRSKETKTSNATAMAHCSRLYQTVGPGVPAGHVSIDSWAAANYAAAVWLTRHVSQSGQTDWTILLTNRETIATVGVTSLVCQVIRASWVAPSDGALLEVTFEDIASRERVLTQMAHVGSVTSMSQQVTLQMLSVQIRLVAMRTRVLSICVLLRYHALGACTASLCWRVRASRGAGQDTAPSLRTNNMRGSLLILQERGLLTKRVASQAGQTIQAATVHTPGRHGTKAWKATSSTGRRHGRCGGGRVHRSRAHAVRVIEAVLLHHATLLVGGGHVAVGIVGAGLLHGRGHRGVRGVGRMGTAAGVGEGEVAEGEAAVLVLQRRQGGGVVRRRVMMVGLGREVAEGANALLGLLLRRGRRLLLLLLLLMLLRLLLLLLLLALTILAVAHIAIEGAIHAGGEG